MNERVWLQSSVTFVNTKQAISLGFLATFLTFSCSPAEDNGNIDKNPHQIVDDTKPNILPTAPIIWESKEAAGDILDLAIAKNTSNSVFGLAILSDGRAESFDIDGISIAQSNPNTFKSAALGMPLTISDTSFVAFPSLTYENTIQVALFSSGLQVIAAAPLSDSISANSLCAAPLPSDADTPTSAIAFLNDDKLTLGTLQYGGETPVFKEVNSFTTPNLASACLYDGSNGIVISDKKITSFSTQGILSTINTSNFINDARLLEAESGQILVYTNQKGNLFISHLGDDGTLSSPQQFELSDGMSVSAPAKATQIGSLSGHINVDYPAGILMITGEYDDGRNRLSYVNPEPLYKIVGANPPKSSNEPLETDLENLKSALTPETPFENSEQ